MPPAQSPRGRNFWQRIRITSRSRRCFKCWQRQKITCPCRPKRTSPISSSRPASWSVRIEDPGSLKFPSESNSLKANTGGLMEPRRDFQKIAPQAYRAMAGLEAYIRNSGLEPGLLELVKLRASQINGCAYCIDMHSKDARASGETE